jgi:ATP/maltotriose-dependent transcriptional regulator MalT
VELAERVLRHTSEQTVLQRTPALEVLVAAHAARGDLDRAEAALAQLRDLARRVGTVPLRAAADLAGGITAAARGDHERARRCLEDAVDEFERSGAPFEAAQARMELATSLTALGRSTDAAHEAQVGLDSLTRLGAEAGVRRGRSVLEMAANPDTSPGRKTAPVPQVTHREREVLRCVAEGLTNREIANHLVISEHTVHRHVTNILRKLDLPSRTAAAAHAIRAGLLDSPSK